ncbi:MAG: hypothetical protein AAB800_00320 [Patescibacteria group bacterium]
MTITRTLKTELYICSFILIVFTGFSLWRAKNANPDHLSKVIIAGETVRTDIPVVTNPILKVDTASQPTPDGKKKLLMEATHKKDNSTYVFTTSDGSGGNIQPLFTTTVQASASASEGLSIPFNTWSPDNKYLFIQKNDGNAWVFNATGEEIIPGQRYFDVKDLFSAAGRKDTYEVTTGWASPTLLIVNTRTPDDTKGSSYWFEVPSKAIIQLSSQF